MGGTTIVTKTWDTSEKEVSLVIEHEYVDMRSLGIESITGKITCKNQGEVNLLNVEVKILMDDNLDFWDTVFANGTDQTILQFGHIPAGEAPYLNYYVTLNQVDDLPQDQATYTVLLIPSYQVEYSIKQSHKYETIVAP